MPDLSERSVPIALNVALALYRRGLPVSREDQGDMPGSCNGRPAAGCSELHWAARRELQMAECRRYAVTGRGSSRHGLYFLVHEPSAAKFSRQTGRGVPSWMALQQKPRCCQWDGWSRAGRDMVYGAQRTALLQTAAAALSTFLPYPTPPSSLLQSRPAREPRPLHSTSNFLLKGAPKTDAFVQPASGDECTTYTSKYKQGLLDFCLGRCLACFP